MAKKTTIPAAVIMGIAEMARQHVPEAQTIVYDFVNTNGFCKNQIMIRFIPDLPPRTDFTAEKSRSQSVNAQVTQSQQVKACCYNQAPRYM